MVDYSRRTFGSGAIGALAAMSSTSPEARPLTELRPTSSGEAQPTGASPADPFASGLKPEDDFALTGPVPGVPQMIETFNLWLYDGARDICYNTSPHLHEGTCRALATVFLPGGRILRRHNGDDDRFDNPRRFGSRYVQYECVEPYRRWIYRLKDVPMIETSDAEVAAGGMTSDQPSRRVSAEIHLKTLSPAWIMGSLLPECAKLNRIQAGFWMGSRLPSGPSPLTRRYEQLAQGEGVITVDGEEFAFKGSGMRAHVRGVRDTHGMPGHYWASAVFPSGKGFAVVGYQQPDGTTLYHEGYVWQDRKVYPVRNVWVPPMQEHHAASSASY